MKGKGGILFVSTMSGSPWGGSEELWGRTALKLVERGLQITASVEAHSPAHARLREMATHGINVWQRPPWYSRKKKPLSWFLGRDPAKHEVLELIKRLAPSLVVFSSGTTIIPVEFLELCIASKIGFVTISQANYEDWWPPDWVAERLGPAMKAALRCYFVSEGNLRLAERQLGVDLPNAEVVRNPVNLPPGPPPDWPHLDESGELRLACVARLHPAAKGHDILFGALAGDAWRQRKWRLYLYGEGPVRRGLERLAARYGISDRVVFAGFVPPRDIWAANHVLVMASRYEGLPLAMVEAMMCARPIVATDVAGHAEIVEDGVTGFLADAPNIASIATALERVWENRVKAEAMGKAGLARISTLFSNDPVEWLAEQIETLLETSIAE